MAGGRERNLYEVLGAICRDLAPDEARAAHLAVAVLQRLFRRPVFLREVRECGFPSGYEAAMVEEEGRREARDHLAKVGVKIPLSEPAYAVEGRREGKVEEALGRLVVECFGVSGLVLETKQTRLRERER